MQYVSGYESCHESGRHPKSKGATKDAKEDAERFQHGHGLKAVAVVSCRLVRHDGAEGQIDRVQANKKHAHGKREIGTY